MHSPKSQITWINHSDINRQKWDSCIDTCVWGNVYALSWFLDLITNNQWEAIVIGDYEFIMPVPFRKKFGIKYTYRPNFCQQLGVFTNSELTPSIISDFIHELLKNYKQIHYPLNHHNRPPDEMSIKIRTNFVLNLEADYFILYQNYSGDLKNNLKKAYKNNLSFIENIDFELVISMYKKAWQSLNKIPDKDYSNFKKIVELAYKKGSAQSSGVFKGDDLLASCFILKYKDRLYYPFSSISSEGRKYGATAFLIDGLIKKNSGAKLLLDFEGSDIESVKSFYQKFNPEIEHYYQLDKTIPFLNNLSRLFKGKATK